MTTTKTLAWIERLVWILIYGGLFMLILGIATLGESPATGWSLITVGTCAAIAGVALIWVRARSR